MRSVAGKKTLHVKPAVVAETTFVFEPITELIIIKQRLAHAGRSVVIEKTDRSLTHGIHYWKNYLRPMVQLLRRKRPLGVASQLPENPKGTAPIKIVALFNEVFLFKNKLVAVGSEAVRSNTHKYLVGKRKAAHPQGSAAWAQHGFSAGSARLAAHQAAGIRMFLRNEPTLNNLQMHRTGQL